MDPISESLSLIRAALVRLGIRFAVGGSMASATRGVWRATLDIDLVAAIHPNEAAQLVRELGPEWYADEEAIRRSIEQGRCFNVIHIRTAQKIDIFPATGEFHQAQLNRATVVPLGAGRVPCPVATAEDILLAKLLWYRMGGEVSERQWADITGIVEANSTLDTAYLEAWGRRLGVGGLLAKALGARPL